MTKTYLTKKREDLLAWFHKEAKPLAETYEAALRLLDEKDFPDRILLIAHTAREICNSLPEILDPLIKGDRVQYENSLDEIVSNWPTITNIESEKAVDDAQEQTVRIKLKVALQINSLIESHRKSKQPPTKFEMLFRILMRNQPSEADINLQLVKDFKNMTRKFVKWAHVLSKRATPVIEDELQRQFGKFEDTLYSLVGNFFIGTERLDELLNGIQPDQIDEILSLLASPHH